MIPTFSLPAQPQGLPVAPLRLEAPRLGRAELVVPKWDPILFPTLSGLQEPRPEVSPPAEEPPPEEEKDESRAEKDAKARSRPPAAQVAMPPVMPPGPQTQQPEPEGWRSSQATDTSQPDTVSVKVPGLDIDVPMPTGEVISVATVTAAAASVASVVGALSAKRLVQLLKPIFTAALKKLQTARGKPVETFGRQRLRLRRHRATRRGSRGGS